MNIRKQQYSRTKMASSNTGLLEYENDRFNGFRLGGLNLIFVELRQSLLVGCFVFWVLICFSWSSVDLTADSGLASLMCPFCFAFKNMPLLTFWHYENRRTRLHLQPYLLIIHMSLSGCGIPADMFSQRLKLQRTRERKCVAVKHIASVNAL